MTFSDDTTKINSEIYSKDNLGGVVEDFYDREQSFIVRLEKLKWGLEGTGKGIKSSIEQLNQMKMNVPEPLLESVRINKAHQDFVDLLITHLNERPEPELLLSYARDTEKFVEEIESYLPKPEQEKFITLLRVAQHKYDELRRHPLLELFKKMGNRAQKKLMAFAEKLERKENE